jgi:hypothetical protein
VPERHTHAPAHHAPGQLEPAQHGSSGLPHDAVGVLLGTGLAPIGTELTGTEFQPLPLKPGSQTPKLQTSPCEPLQVSPPQHDWPHPPQPKKLPLPFEKPVLLPHVFPPKLLPNGLLVFAVTGGSHRHAPNVHVSPMPHRNPRQQPWNIAPHG